MSRAGRREWIGLTVLNLAVPSLSAVIAIGVAILAAALLRLSRAHA